MAKKQEEKTMWEKITFKNLLGVMLFFNVVGLMAIWLGVYGAATITLFINCIWFAGYLSITTDDKAKKN